MRSGPRAPPRTQGEVAEAANISVSFLSMIERGERSAGLETLHDIAAALGGSLEELFADGSRTPEQHSSYPLLIAFAKKRRLNRRQVAQLLAVAKAMFRE